MDGDKARWDGLLAQYRTLENELAATGDPDVEEELQAVESLLEISEPDSDASTKTRRGCPM